MTPERKQQLLEKRKRALSVGLAPCPWCKKKPRLIPTDPENEGDAWAAVRCFTVRCPARPNVGDGSNIAGTTLNYFMLAVKRWNRCAAFDVPVQTKEPTHD